MKKTKLFCLITFIWIGFAGTIFAQRSFYVSASGNDSNSGTSPNTPWKTISKINSNKGTFKAGDTINFKRGDVFYGSLNFAGKKGTATAPIVLKSYDSGKIPVIRASRIITGWTKDNGNIWKTSLATVNNKRIPSLFINNQAQQIGREPNASLPNGGYRVIANHSNSYTSISESSPLPYAANQFKGAEITIRNTDDNVKTEIVTSHSENTVNFSLSNPSSNFENLIENNFGYFFQNHKNALDVNGEWAHDINTNTIYLYSDTDPNDETVEIPSEDNAAKLDNAKYLRVESLRFEAGLSTTLAISGAEDLTFDKCYLYNGNAYLSLGYNLKNITFKNGVLNQSNNVGIRWERFTGITFTNNKIMNIGLRPGMGLRSFIGYTGVRFVSGGASVSRNFINSNTLSNIGYHALNFSGGNFEIKNNNIQKYCLTKDDGGGIYTVGNQWNNNKIFKNIVHDTPGAILGSPPNRGVKTAGIYLDNDSKEQEVYENSVYNIRGWGLMANLSGSNIYRDNTVFNCSFGLVSSTYPNTFANGDAAQAANNTVLRNIFFNKTPSQLCGRYSNQITPNNFNSHLGNFNHNYYVQPFSGGKEISLRVGRKESEVTLPEFKATYSNYEKNSKSSPKKFDRNSNPNEIIRLEVNTTENPKTVDLGNTNYIDAKNNIFSGSATLAPYSILVLLKESTATPTTNTDTNPLILDGTYFITSTTSNQRLGSVDNTNNHEAYMANPSNMGNQKWIFTHLDDNIYTIKNAETKRYLEVPLGKCENSTQVSTHKQDLDKHQKWKIVANGTNVFGINPAHCIEQGLDRNFGRQNTNVITYTFDKDNNNQKWGITNVDDDLTDLSGVTIDDNLHIYPNPATLTITVEGLSNANTTLEISNLLGQILINKPISIDNNIVDVSQLQSSLYLVTITNIQTNEELVTKLLVR